MQKDAPAGVLVFYGFFIGRFESQYGQAADCFPVHLTSWERIGPPQCGQVAGSKSTRWVCSTGAVAIVGGAGGGIYVAGGGGFCGHSRLESRKSELKTMPNPINTKMPGHQCPRERNIARTINQKPPRNPHGRKSGGPYLNLRCLCISHPFTNKSYRSYDNIRFSSR